MPHTAETLQNYGKIAGWCPLKPNSQQNGVSAFNLYLCASKGMHPLWWRKLCTPAVHHVIYQQLTYGVVSEGVFGNSAENSRKFPENMFYCVRKGCGNSAESLREFRENLRTIFCNDPFPNDPISALLNIAQLQILRL